MNPHQRFRSPLPLFGLTLLFFAGCSRPVVPSEQAAAERHAEIASERDQISNILPPTKTRYMAVHSFDSWENPYLTVQGNMVTIHVLLADANTTPYGIGGMLRPVGARREELNVGPEKLAEAMSSIPQSAWPYGRVVAVEEAHNTPVKQEPVVRRNMERTVGLLNELGIMAYDLSEGSLR